MDGIATFIDFAYNVYDGTRNIMKGIGLEGAFDAIMKAVEVAITVLTFALGAKSLGGFGDSRGGKGKPGRSKPQTRIAGPKGNLLGSQDRVTSLLLQEDMPIDLVEMQQKRDLVKMLSVVLVESLVGPELLTLLEVLLLELLRNLVVDRVSRCLHPLER